MAIPATQAGKNHMTRFARVLALGAVLLGSAAGLSAATDETAPSAQGLLFDATYLVPLQAPSRLVYSYVTKTIDKERFGKDLDDEVALRMSVSAAGGGEKDVFVDMFTGDQQRVLGPLNRVSGNPIIMMFLERDVSQMNMHVGGQPVYFRNVIRLAFREAAKLEPATIEWEGKQVNATKITIRPFINDNNGARMQLFRTKTYEFIVSDAVPGGIYQVHSTISGVENEPAAIDTKMTLKGISYDQPKN
jgi:hypothetical protein